MRSLSKMLLLAAMTGALKPGSMRGQQSADSARIVLRGSVRDGATGEPIAGASVRASTSVASVTDDHGAFALEVSTRGTVTLHVARLGYDSLTVDIDASSANRATIELHRTAQTLDTVAVATRATSWSPKLEGFEQRLARQNGGTFSTRQDIVERRPLAVSELVRRAPGVRLVDSNGCALVCIGPGEQDRGRFARPSERPLHHARRRRRARDGMGLRGRPGRTRRDLRH